MLRRRALRHKEDEVACGVEGTSSPRTGGATVVLDVSGAFTAHRAVAPDGHVVEGVGKAAISRRPMILRAVFPDRPPGAGSSGDAALQAARKTAVPRGARDAKPRNTAHGEYALGGSRVPTWAQPARGPRGGGVEADARLLSQRRKRPRRAGAPTSSRFRPCRRPRGRRSSAARSCSCTST